MRTSKHYLIVLMTLFTLNSFSQTTYEFSIKVPSSSMEFDTTVNVYIGDIVSFKNELTNGCEMYVTESLVDQNMGNYYYYPVGMNSIFHSKTLNIITVGSYFQNNYIDTSYNFRINSNYPTSFITYTYRFRVHDLTTGIGENTLGYSIYPNPTTDCLNIDGVNTESVKIFDMSGRLMLMVNENKVNVSNLESGYYTVLVNEGRPIKFLKN